MSRWCCLSLLKLIWSSGLVVLNLVLMLQMLCSQASVIWYLLANHWLWWAMTLIWEREWIQLAHDQLAELAKVKACSRSVVAVHRWDHLMMVQATSLWFLITIDAVVHDTFWHHMSLHQRAIWLNFVLGQLLKYATQVLRILINVKFICLHLVHGCIQVTQIGAIGLFIQRLRLTMTK